jgi:heme/copper-type cytochrome/quinol oxidase subunit 2
MSTEKIYGWGLPVAASTYAKDIDFGIYLIHAAMLAIFILWGIFFTYLLIRYRKKPGVPAQRDDGHESLMGLLPDIAVTIFEIGLIFFYAIPVWSRIKIHSP